MVWCLLVFSFGIAPFLDGLWQSFPTHKKLFVMNIKVKIPDLTAFTLMGHERERWNWFQIEGQTTCCFNKLKIR